MAIKEVEKTDSHSLSKGHQLATLSLLRMAQEQFERGFILGILLARQSNTDAEASTEPTEA